MSNTALDTFVQRTSPETGLAVMPGDEAWDDTRTVRLDLDPAMVRVLPTESGGAFLRIRARRDAASAALMLSRHDLRVLAETLADVVDEYDREGAKQ